MIIQAIVEENNTAVALIRDQRFSNAVSACSAALESQRLALVSNSSTAGAPEEELQLCSPRPRHPLDFVDQCMLASNVGELSDYAEGNAFIYNKGIECQRHIFVSEPPDRYANLDIQCGPCSPPCCQE